MPAHSDDSRDARLVDIVLWAIVGALLLAAAASSIGILEREVYSPRGLVHAYLGALADHDVDAALSFPGVADSIKHTPGTSKELLRSDLLSTITDIEVISDAEFGTGRHLVTAQYRVDGEAASSAFMLEPTGTTAGIFPRWRFAETPLGVLSVTVEHATTFSVGGHTLDTRLAAPKESQGAFTTVGDYLVFLPSRFTLAHHSRLLTSKPTVALVTRPDDVTRATVDAQPTRAFTQAVQTQLDSFLDSCTTQKVLQPSGCPFGTVIDDRVRSDPEWSIASYPKVALAAGQSGWLGAPAEGAARIRVTVQSLYDGSMEDVDREEPFTIALDPITIGGDGAVHVTVTTPGD